MAPGSKQTGRVPAATDRPDRDGRPSRLAAAGDPGTRPVVTEEASPRTELGRPWNVIVWDDPVNLMSYVSYVFQKLFGFSAEVAHTKMLEVHNEGRSIVATEERERAEHHVSRLHVYGLNATMEQVADGGT